MRTTRLPAASSRIVSLLPSVREVVDTVELAPGDVQAPTFAPVASSALSKLTSCLGRDGDRPRLRVQLHRRGAREDLDLLLGVPLRRSEQRVVRVTPCPAGTPSSRAGGCRAGRARGRSGGSSLRRPTRRSQRAQSPAARARRRSARSRRDGRPSSVAAGSSQPSGANCGVISPSSPGSRIEQHLVALLNDRVGLRDEAGAAAEHRDDQAPSGSAMSLDLLPRRRRLPRHLELDDLQALLFEREQLDEPVARDLVLDQAQDEVGCGHGGLDPEQAEVVVVAGVVDARDDRSQRYFSLAT